VFVTLDVVVVMVVVGLYFIIWHANLHQNLLVKHGAVGINGQRTA